MTNTNIEIKWIMEKISKGCSPDNCERCPLKDFKHSQRGGQLCSMLRDVNVVNGEWGRN